MAKQSEPAPASSRPGLDVWMATRRQSLSVGLLVASALLAIIPIYHLILYFRNHSGNTLVFLWGLFLALLALVGGLALQVEPPGTASEREGRYRLLALILGGLAGFATFLLGLGLPLGPWAARIVPAATTKEAEPILQVWKDNWWRIGVIALAVLGGLVVMFLSLQLARSVERASAGMRRLLYGYNAALTGLLLFAILGLVNVLSYVHLWPFTLFGQQIDWTPSQLYTLSPRSVNILKKEVTGSVEVLVLMPTSDPLTEEINRLINNIKQQNPRFTVSYISPDVSRNEFAKTLIQYAKLIDRAKLSPPDSQRGRIGLIVVYRNEGKEDAQFIPYSDLSSRTPGQRQRMVFRGENQVMRALVRLIDKTPAKVVFTRGHGELGSEPAGRPGMGGSLADLKRLLNAKGNYEFKEATLGVEGAKGLEDADVVVIARPTRAFPPKAIEALRNYLNPTGTSKKGKLIVLLDTRVQDGKMLHTGLEPLLRSYGVEISDKRILTNTDKPESVLVASNPETTNPLATSFSGLGRRILYFHEPRRVQAAQGGNRLYKVDEVFTTLSGRLVWEESNLTAPGLDLLNRYLKQAPEDRPKAEVDVPVAVAVSETKPQPGLPAGHVPVSAEAPRMVVFGDASWLSDDEVSGDRGTNSVDLFATCVSWLRGRSDLGPDVAPDKDRADFTLRDKLQPDDVRRLEWLPLGLLFVSIAGLGGGIWVIRRR